jgi:hypothetical protein
LLRRPDIAGPARVSERLSLDYRFSAIKEHKKRIQPAAGVSMQAGMSRRGSCARGSGSHKCRHLFGVVAILLTGLLAAGCNTLGQPTAAFAVAQGATVAFESIDGAPPAVFHRLVQNLSEEAAARAVPVVSRQGAAEYRVRGYLAALTSGRRTTVAWVWDVYDREQRRALRIAGEQRIDAPGGDARRDDPWAAADDRVLRAIARTSMERVATFLAAPAAAPPAPDAPTYTVASASPRDDFSPEAWGIFRLFRVSNASASVLEAATPPPAEVPLPRRRPRTAGVTPDRVLAYAGARQ